MIQNASSVLHLLDSIKCTRPFMSRVYYNSTILTGTVSPQSPQVNQQKYGCENLILLDRLC
jgi:hypothetical protein